MLRFSAELTTRGLLTTREQAIAIAAECPAAKWATVEVRELGPCFE
jgi:hypothetical protein